MGGANSKTLCVMMREGKKAHERSDSGALHGGVGPDRVWRLVLDVAARQGRALGQPDWDGRHELEPGRFQCPNRQRRQFSFERVLIRRVGTARSAASGSLGA